ncbi:hypothetical protein [Streptomyces sp. NPDC004728]|uniref:hypothetical protein n=1 Tax=Streptomyces sp. NPDC004728 TaxID=3154289 RepID=UPI0033A69A3D
MAEIAADAAGRWRHPVRIHRIRTDITADEVPLFGHDGIGSKPRGGRAQSQP